MLHTAPASSWPQAPASPRSVAVPVVVVLGYRVFERIAFGSATSRLWVYDYAECLGDDVAALAERWASPSRSVVRPGATACAGKCGSRAVGADVRRRAPVADALGGALIRGGLPFLRGAWATLQRGAIVFVKDEQDVEDEAAVRLLGGDARSVPGVRGGLPPPRRVIACCSEQASLGGGGERLGIKRADNLRASARRPRCPR